MFVKKKTNFKSIIVKLHRHFAELRLIKETNRAYDTLPACTVFQQP